MPSQPKSLAGQIPKNMAELVIAVRDQSNFEDGDILCAFNDDRIGRVHCEQICHPKNFGFARDGLREPGTLLETLQELSYQYKFHRVSRTEVSRTELSTGKVEVFTNQTRPRIHVAEWIARRKAHPTHKIFGPDRREFWFGGRYTPDVDAIWSEIEQRSSLRRKDHTLWPLSEQEKRSFLSIRTQEDFDNDIANTLVTPELVDPDDETSQKREHFVVWRDIADLPHRDIEDKNIPVDLRGSVNFSWPEIVETRLRG